MLPELQTAAGMTFFCRLETRSHFSTCAEVNVLCVCVGVCVLNARNKVYG